MTDSADRPARLRFRDRDPRPPKSCWEHRYYWSARIVTYAAGSHNPRETTSSQLRHTPVAPFSCRTRSCVGASSSETHGLLVVSRVASLSASRPAGSAFRSSRAVGPATDPEQNLHSRSGSNVPFLLEGEGSRENILVDVLRPVRRPSCGPPGGRWPTIRWRHRVRQGRRRTRSGAVRRRARRTSGRGPRRAAW